MRVLHISTLSSFAAPRTTSRYLYQVGNPDGSSFFPLTQYFIDYQFLCAQNALTPPISLNFTLNRHTDTYFWQLADLLVFKTPRSLLTTLRDDISQLRVDDKCPVNTTAPRMPRNCSFLVARFHSPQGVSLTSMHVTAKFARQEMLQTSQKTTSLSRTYPATDL